jgi:hypothetical protein
VKIMACNSNLVNPKVASIALGACQESLAMEWSREILGRCPTSWSDMGQRPDLLGGCEFAVCE